MWRLLGAVLLAFGCGWVGFQASLALSRREAALRATARGLALLEQELELDSPPLPQLMERLARRTQEPACGLFRACRLALEHLEEEAFSPAWRHLTGELESLGEEGRAALLPLGDILGRCGCQEQCQGVSGVRRRLEELAARAEEERRSQGRVYQALGLSGGAFLIILLL